MPWVYTVEINTLVTGRLRGKAGQANIAARAINIKQTVQVTYQGKKGEKFVCMAAQLRARSLLPNILGSIAVGANPTQLTTCLGTDGGVYFP
jgi:hypothetical protein